MQGKGRGKTIRYATKARLAKVNPENLKAYEQYIRSNVIRNKDVANTTYKVYRSYFNIFMCFIMENHDNFFILDEDILEDEMLDIMEDYISFLQEELNNNKKSINTKISAISSFYIWAVKRRRIKKHPFDGQLERMQGAGDEKIIAEHFLTQEEVNEIKLTLDDVESPISEYDKIDQLIWNIAFDSACRIGALTGLKLSNLELENRRFINVREKRGKIVNIPFSADTARMLEEFIEQRRVLNIDCDDIFFVTRGDQWQGMSKQSIYNRIRKIGHIIGIGDFRPHSIRKTRLNMIYKQDAQLAQQLANHADMSTTQKYYSEPEDQTEVFDKIEKLGL